MAVQIGRKYQDSQVRRLVESVQPVPFEAFAIDYQAPSKGAPNRRVAADGQKWCPYCQTPLLQSEHACAACRPRRKEALDNKPRPKARASNALPASTNQHLDDLWGTLEEMATCVGLATSHFNWGDLSKQKELIDRWFMVSKKVQVAAERVRVDLQEHGYIVKRPTAR